jgi:tRNA (uracil-5-)-methyltransferase
LYCGNANHSCALAGVFERVVAVEIDAKLVCAAKESCTMNGVTNVEVVLADSQNFAKRMTRGKCKDASGNAMLAEDFDVVLVDPPRAGLDDDTLELVGKFKHILYVSCGPDNLLKNMDRGMREHAFQRFAILDHFAYTKHIEVAVYMRRETDVV